VLEASAGERFLSRRRIFLARLNCARKKRWRSPRQFLAYLPRRHKKDYKALANVTNFDYITITEQTP
jgi:hypothetical protein